MSAKEIKDQLLKELFVLNGQIDTMKYSSDYEKRSFLIGRKFQINKTLEMLKGE